MDQQTTDAEVDRISGACGCEEGAAVSLLALVAYATWAWFDESLSAVQTIALGAVVFVLAGGVGKAAGLLRARRRLRHSLETLARRPTSGPSGAGRGTSPSDRLRYG